MKIKKSIFLILIFTLLIIFSLNINPVYAEEALDISSDAVIILENKTGKVLFEKNSEQKMYPASTTKIISAIIAIEKANLKDVVTVSRNAIAQMKPGYSSAYLVEGEKISVEDLITVLLVHSANEASNVLAEHICGSIEKFVDLMNSKAKEIGCTNTHFVTTNGLHDDNHYTTAKDLSMIARYCMKNETFRKIVSMKKCTIPATNKSGPRTYKNTNDLLNPSSAYYYPSCIGIKTGYTSEAKNCLVSACNKNGLQLIAVVLGSHLAGIRYTDSKTLYNYAYTNYSIETIAKESTVLNTIEVKNATKETKNLDLILEKDISALINKKDKENINFEISLNSSISAPIAKNAVLGTVTYTVNDETYKANLLASHEVEESHFQIMLLRFALAFVITIILILIIILIIKKGKYKEKH